MSPDNGALFSDEESTDGMDLGGAAASPAQILDRGSPGVGRMVPEQCGILPSPLPPVVPECDPMPESSSISARRH